MTRSDSPKRFAYADPPYIGQAKRLYGGHKDYGGEVDHAELIERLSSEFDCWALSASVKSLRELIPLCPTSILVLSWIKPIAPPMGDNRHYSWEPVITWGTRRPAGPTRMHVVASPPQFTFRERPPEHVIGEKPPEFCRWLFQACGLTPDDEMVDLFPGSGAVGRAWESYCSDPSVEREKPMAKWLGGSEVKAHRPSLGELEAAGYRLTKAGYPAMEDT